MRSALHRLRWQLTLSHLVAIAVTLVSMIAAVLLIASAWWTRSADPALQPAQDARAIAQSIGGLVLRDLAACPPAEIGAAPQAQAGCHADALAGSALSTGELSVLLGQIARGDVRLLGGGPPVDPLRLHPASSVASANLAYVVLVDRDQRVLASSDPQAAAFAPPERDQWPPVLAAALAGATDPAHLLARSSGAGPAAFGAFPILDQTGQPVAAVLVADASLPPASGSGSFWEALLLFGAASVAVLAAASLFALASSSLVSYVLSRRLVRRLERLEQAAESFAAGDLSCRVEAGAADEVGQLARRFNAMADRLSETLAELADQKRSLEAALQAKRELVANVSHELRTPLASIRGHTESLLLRGAADADALGYLEIIHRQSEQLSRLIDDLFLLSTTEAGALPLVVRPLPVAEVIAEVVGSLRAAASAERQVHVFSEVEADLPPVLADRQRLAQVLANLVRNAVRHTPEGGLVAVRGCRRDPYAALISVEDTGAGIASDELQHVFERFYRADPSRDRSSGGAGLGLAIVRELVVAMGGEVGADSVVGEGSRFWFSLPLAQPAAVPTVERYSSAW